MRTTDVEFITSCMTHMRIWPHVSDDFSPHRNDFEPVMDDKLYYLAPEDEAGDPVGVFFLHPHSTILFEIHTCVLPAYWGPVAVRSARAAMRWMVENTYCRKIITHVPYDNTLALRFAKRVGMIPEGTNRESFQKDGVLLDQHVLGITEGEISCL
jgi:RimJ/RimL family protein N-acetyltransferase